MFSLKSYKCNTLGQVMLGNNRLHGFGHRRIRQKEPLPILLKLIFSELVLFARRQINEKRPFAFKNVEEKYKKRIQ